MALNNITVLQEQADGSLKETLLTPANIGAAASSHDHPIATNTTAGFLSAADKQKLVAIKLPLFSIWGGSADTPCFDGGTVYWAAGIHNDRTYYLGGRFQELYIEYTGTAWRIGEGGSNYTDSEPTDALFPWDSSFSSFLVPVEKGTVPTYHIHEEAASFRSGFMSAADKTKLDGLQSALDVKATTDLVGSPVEYVLACSSETTALIAGTAKVTFRAPVAFRLTSVSASTTIAPTGSTLIVDINNGANSALSTKLSIDATKKTSSTAAVSAVIDTNFRDFSQDAEITIDVDQIGSLVAGAGLKVVLRGTRL